MCTFLANANATDDLGRLVEVARSIMGSDVSCAPLTYDLVIETYKQSDENSPVVEFGIRQFVYQECSSLGWFPTSSSPYQPFGAGFSVDLFYNICMDSFEHKCGWHSPVEKLLCSLNLLYSHIYRFDKDIIDRNEYLFNTLHSGLDFNVTNVIFTQGEWDPFRVLGIQNDPNEFSPVFVIPGI